MLRPRIDKLSVFTLLWLTGAVLCWVSLFLGFMVNKPLYLMGLGLLLGALAMKYDLDLARYRKALARYRGRNRIALLEGNDGR